MSARRKGPPRRKAPTPRRAARLLEAMRRAIDSSQEAMDLGASTIACDVADAWIACGTAEWQRMLLGGNMRLRALASALNRLELVTRKSAMRKVRP